MNPFFLISTRSPDLNHNAYLLTTQVHSLISKYHFVALTKAQAYLQEKHPEVSVELMYNLAGQRGKATIQNCHFRHYASYIELFPESISMR